MCIYVYLLIYMCIYIYMTPSRSPAAAATLIPRVIVFHRLSHHFCTEKKYAKCVHGLPLIIKFTSSRGRQTLLL